MAATTILLVRHGETDWNRDRRVQGHTDVPLNETGREQARALAGELAGEPLAAVYSSDLSRALETATIVAEPRSLAVTTLPALREKHFGTWEGLTDAEVLTRFPDAHATGWGDGETTEEMADRVLAAVREIGAGEPWRVRSRRHPRRPDAGRAQALRGRGRSDRELPGRPAHGRGRTRQS